MQNLKKMNLAEIVKSNILTAPVFEEYGIDFCCPGYSNLEEVCEERGIDIDFIIEKLNKARLGNSDIDIDFYAMEEGELCDYIVNKHHSYVTLSLPQIQNHLVKLIEKDCDKHPELEQVLLYFSELRFTLEPHLRKEEFVLFPYIKSMCETINAEPGSRSSTSLIRNPINVLIKEHDHAVEYLRDIKALTEDFKPPADACTTHKLVLAELDAFEKDLHVHVHLENNILFPKVIELEKKLNRRDQK